MFVPFRLLKKKSDASQTSSLALYTEDYQWMLLQSLCRVYILHKHILLASENYQSWRFKFENTADGMNRTL